MKFSDESPAMSRLPLYCATLVLAGLLAACVPSDPVCGGDESRELRTVDNLIGETRTDMGLGYRQESRGGLGFFNFCLGGGGSNVGISFCADPSVQSRVVPVDMATEKRKLKALEARRVELQRAADQKARLCAAQRTP